MGTYPSRIRPGKGRRFRRREFEIRDKGDEILVGPAQGTQLQEIPC
ncbi:MAG TPA: hypothetical protein PLW73_10095 [Methanoregulaceae archaeon]|nr:hypothetical protein [Methanoregulaceae archaeon]